MFEQAQYVNSDPTLTALVVTLAMGLVEIIKILVGWIGKKVTKQHSQTLLVQLDPEVSQIIHETGNEVKDVRAVISRVDADGVPLVYADRKVEHNVESIATALNKTVEQQAVLASALQKLMDRFEEHDRSDALTFARIVDSQARLETTVSQTKDNILELRRDIRNGTYK